MRGRDLMLSCPTCRHNVVMTYGGEGPYRWQPWICPHCSIRNGLNLAGMILKVEKSVRES